MIGETDGFVCGGLDRALEAITREIRAEVDREFADRLAGAKGWRRWRIEREIRRELGRRVAQDASPWTLE